MKCVMDPTGEVHSLKRPAVTRDGKLLVAETNCGEELYGDTGAYLMGREVSCKECRKATAQDDKQIKLVYGQAKMVTKITRPTGDLQIGSGKPIMTDIAEFTTWMEDNVERVIKATLMANQIRPGDKVVITIEILDNEAWAAKKKEEAWE
jgi:hypothetical protein